MNREDPGNNAESFLIQRIKEGEESAFEIAFLKYHTPLCQFTWKYVQSRQVAREIVQEVFTTVWEDRRNLDPDGHLRGYLYEMTRNQALDYIKHQKTVEQYISEAKERKQEAYQSEHLIRDRDQNQLKDVIEEAIANLPPRGRQIFELNREEGLTYKEIAEFLDISPKTVETHMRRALQKLRDYLSDVVPPVIFIGILLQYFFIG